MSRGLMIVVLGLVCCGCGGRYDFETVPVSGIVTLDGEPLADAMVIFQPVQGRPAAGVTDASGFYSVRYLEQKAGALPGAYKVQITTRREPDSDSDDPEKQKGAPERVPPKYNSRTTLEVKVEPGKDSAYDFELSSPKSR